MSIFNSSKTDGWDTYPFITLDIEATDKDPLTSDALSVALIHPHDEVIEWYIDYQGEIPFDSYRIHGLTKEILHEDGYPAEDVFPEIARVLGDYIDKGVPVCGFNISYDLTILFNEFEKHNVQLGNWEKIRVIDPLILDYSVNKIIGKRKLTDLCRIHNIPTGKSHDAKYDCLATKKLALQLAKENTEIAQLKLDELTSHQRKFYVQRLHKIYGNRLIPDAELNYPLHNLSWEEKL